MLIKICGITEESEVEYLNELTPDYIGFVFAESKRKVTIEKAIRLKDILNKNIKVVGVFKDLPIEEVILVSKVVGLDVIQLHGKEDNDYIIRLNGLNREIWKAVSVKKGERINEHYNVDKMIFDGPQPGSGKVINFDEGFNPSKEFIISGGLNPDNVVGFLAISNVIGVDVSSGVEELNKEGYFKKDYFKLKKFIERVRSYEKSKYKGKI
ncbi:phosphoribosylanthranilate isomerase [Clostridium cavendishii DSM 21758]|uniref:N-(5'-phosphoribosyl)anthranilate isomerase n=1 Tax=Clostridium cavendishii DSM 21758 TaxID=1121302 RepID=A0A1M6I644_9CLOT|nr:phosphoribosylanthranilate isomerase [Clostridium cavendishii]SHJ29850.1 phosphoribosylanthranilate isomerase [Clostridium cavendishii DSM 21758]